MNPNPGFGLVLSDGVRSAVNALLARAAGSTTYARLAAALQAVERELRNDPRPWGDPVKRFRGLQATLYHRLYDELYVQYTVHDGRPLVWWTMLRPVLGHPLTRG
ncbi:MAG: hypothetical protein K2X82_28145 [Gemmataceae bacterium]|nr:hypothetical protein [Gemmataceae bacterium]